MAEIKLRNQDTEIQTDPSSGSYNVDSDEESGGEALEMKALFRKTFSQ